MNTKYDKILGKIREEDSKTVYPDGSLVFNDNTPSDTSTFTSNKIIAELKALIKEYGTQGRARFDETNKHLYFEVLDNGAWVTKLEIGASVIVDAVKFIDVPTVKPIIEAGQLGIYTKIVTVPDKSGTTHQERRPYFIIPDGTEVPMVGVWEDQLRIPQKDGTNEYAAFKSEILSTNNKTLLESIIESYPNVILSAKDSVLSNDATALFNFRTAILEYTGVETQILEIDEIPTFIGNHRYIFAFNNSRTDGGIASLVPKGSDTIGGLQNISLLANETIIIEKPKTGKNWIVLSHYLKGYGGALTPAALVQLMETPKGNDRVDASAVKNIASEITKELGTDVWQNGGGTHPGTTFTAYYGFYHGETIPESAVKLLSKRELHNSTGDFYGTQATPPNYFYICMPTPDAAHVGSISQSPSTLGTDWTKGTIQIDGVEYTTFRSPHRMYDAAPTFKTLT